MSFEKIEFRLKTVAFFKLSISLLLLGFVCNARAFPAALDFKIPCEQSVLNTLANLGTPTGWIEINLKGANRGFHLLKTPILGSKDVLELEISEKRATVTKTTSAEVISHSFFEKKNCQPLSTLTRKKATVNQEFFSDFDLQAVKLEAKKNERPVVFYAWSLGMPYSKRGLKELTDYTRKKNIKLIGVLDPSSDAKKAQEFVSKNNLPKEFLKRIESRELLSHSLTTHYPSMLVFRKARFETYRPGYDSPQSLPNILEDKL